MAAKTCWLKHGAIKSQNTTQERIDAFAKQISRVSVGYSDQWVQAAIYPHSTMALSLILARIE